MLSDPFDELKRYLEGRFNELGARFDEVPTRTAMNARFDEVPTRTEMNARFDEVPTLATMDAAFREVAITFGELREYVDERTSGIERRTEVLIECVRSDIRLLAEGHGAVAADIQQLKLGQHRTDQRLERLEVGQQALLDVTHRIEGRLGQAEAGQQALLDVTHRIETRLGKA